MTTTYVARQRRPVAVQEDDDQARTADVEAFGHEQQDPLVAVGGVLPQHAARRAVAAAAVLVSDVEKGPLGARDDALVGEWRNIELDERALGRPERRDARIDLVR